MTSLTTNTDTSDDKNGAGTGVPIAVLGGSQGSTGGAKTNNAGQASQNVKGALYGASVADQAQASIKILGDPDWIMQPISAAKSLATRTSKRYGDDYAVDPNGGQIFVEINFNTAEDYNAGTGVININDQIKFYPTDLLRSKLGINGLVYQVVEVKSTFSKGHFSQDLDLLLVDEQNLVSKDDLKNTNTNQREASDTSSATDVRTASNDMSPPVTDMAQQDTSSPTDFNQTLFQNAIPPGLTTAQDDASIQSVDTTLLL
jgi:hypothetical protein